MAVLVTFNEDEWRHLFHSPTGPVSQYVGEITRRVANEARRRAPVDNGTLRASISTSTSVRGSFIVGTVQSKLDYALYVHEGTGLYGPTGRVIRPRRAKALVFPGRGGTVFAKFVRGQKPQPFLVDALRAVVGTAAIT